MKKHRPLIIFMCFILCLSAFTSCRIRQDIGKDPDTADKEQKHRIVFDGRRYTYEGDEESFYVKDDVFTIKRSGSYTVSGELAEGRIVIDCEDLGAVRLILDGITAYSSYGAVIESKNDLILEAKAGTVNLFSNDRYIKNGAVAPEGCIVSHKDTVFTGDGKIVVNSKNTAGISALGNVRIDKGTLTVSSAKYGVWVRDGFLLDGGALTVSYAKIGVCADDGQSSRGYIHIKDGKFVAGCDEIALCAGKEIQITGGEGSIKSPVIYKCEKKIEIKSDKFPKA